MNRFIKAMIILMISILGAVAPLSSAASPLPGVATLTDAGGQ